MSRPACPYCESFDCIGDCPESREAAEYKRALDNKAFKFLLAAQTKIDATCMVSSIPDHCLVSVADLILLLRPDLMVLALTLDDA